MKKIPCTPECTKKAKLAFSKALIRLGQFPHYGTQESIDYLTQYRCRLTDQLAILFYLLGFQPHHADTLSIGGWPGLSACAMAEAGCNVTSIDHPSLTSEATDRFYKSLGITSVAFDFSRTVNYGLPLGKYHVIECCECIEHWNFNPIPAIHQLVNQHLHPGGKLFITVPNGVSLYRRLSVFAGRNPFAEMTHFLCQMQDESHADVSPHWREYSAEDLLILAEACNSTVEYLWSKTYRNSNNMNVLIRTLYTLPQYLFPSLRENLCLVITPKK